MPWMPTVSDVAGGPPRGVRIAGFAKSVDMFSSKQRPKKLTIIGDDFRWALLWLSWPHLYSLAFFMGDTLFGISLARLLVRCGMTIS